MRRTRIRIECAVIRVIKIGKYCDGIRRPRRDFTDDVLEKRSAHTHSWVVIIVAINKW